MTRQPIAYAIRRGVHVVAFYKVDDPTIHAELRALRKTQQDGYEYHIEAVFVRPPFPPNLVATPYRSSAEAMTLWEDWGPGKPRSGLKTLLLKIRRLFSFRLKRRRLSCGHVDPHQSAYRLLPKSLGWPPRVPSSCNCQVVCAD